MQTADLVLTCTVCGAEARRFMNVRACAEHAPAEIAPTPCNKPVRCYCGGPDCVKLDERPADDRRAELDERIEQWRAYARAEIMTLASIGPFGPRDLAALLPLKLAGQHARDWLTRLLDEGVNAGALVQTKPAEWRARRDGEPIQHVETQAVAPVIQHVDADRVERDNRYQ